ncbi:MAG: ABC transporter permease [Blastocatellia bacterium]|nr:ABC transporter permease [Blastocatellia bacterium]MBN8722955.1 ABC transporter permease [Acidobacteriota bacterium]
MQLFIKDLQYGFRMLKKHWAVSIIAIIALALGIGANSAIFSVVNAVLLQPLPYEEAERLIFLSEKSSQLDNMSIAYPNFEDWRDQNRVFESIGVFRNQSYNLVGEGEPERIAGSQASREMFVALRAKPILGRIFLPEEDKPGASPVVILSYQLWQSRFGGQSDILGKNLTLNNQSYTVIGVMPPKFEFPRQVRLWTPVGLSASDPNWNRGNHPGLYGVARLKPNVTIEQADKDLATIAAELEELHPKTNPDNKVVVVSLYERATRDVRPGLLLLLAAVGAVLLIACANVANLMLARAVSRGKEIAIRSVLGANRLRIIRQLLTESLILSLTGGLFGLLIAIWGIDALIAFAGLENMPRVSDIKVDGYVLAFTLGLSCATGIIFGLVPALQATKLDLTESLKETSRNTTSQQQQKLRSLLVIGEIAIALVLLINAGLFIKSFVNLQRLDTGFNPDSILTMTVNLPKTKYPEPTDRINFHNQLLTKLAAVPGIKSVATINRLPLQNGGNQTSFSTEDFPVTDGKLPLTEFGAISPDYFNTMGIKLIAGRFFTEQDKADTPAVAIIDERFAKRFWPNTSAVGKRLKSGDHTKENPWMEIVGVVSSIRYDELTEDEHLIHMYRPYNQTPISQINLAIKTMTDPLGYSSAIRSEILAIDKDQPTFDIKTMNQRVGDSIASRRIGIVLLSLFSTIALVLSSVGIYGVMSYSVSQRTHEIGIRMALGAQTQDVVGMVIKQGMKLALIGVGIGLIGAIACSRAISSLLYGVSTTDPITFILVSSFLVLVALIACYIPARRATKVDPLVALRYE